MRFQPTMLIAFLVLFIGTAILILLAFEGGLRLGRWRAALPDPEPPLPARMIIGSVLSLLAFVLGFTFGVAASHYDSRNQALNDETIAIRTAYHRADLFPEPERTNIRNLLREYVDLRVDGSSAANSARSTARMRQLQEQIWTQAVQVQKKTASGTPPAIALQSLNDVIDVHGERVLTNMRSRIPTGSWIILYSITFIAIAAAGYHSGLAGARRRSIAALAYALVFAAVLAMIADADIPGFGQFETDRHGLIELRGQLSDSDP
jgi:hypothetical protein